MRQIKKGVTSQSVYFDVLSSASTTGGRLTGLAFNTAGLTAYYVRNGGLAVAITLATLAAANSAWSSGGFTEVDATNMPGVYRLDVPDAAFATGVDSVVITIKGAANMVQQSVEIQLIDNTVGEVYTRLGAPAGASLAVDVAAVKAVLPAALVSGRIDASVGSMTADVLTSTALATSAVNEIQAGLSTLDAAGVRGAVGMASANLDTQLGAIAGYIDTEVGTLQTTATAIKAKTDNLPASPAAVSNIPTADQNADALLDRTAGVETNLTVRQAFRLIASALFGKVSGAGTTTEVARDYNDTKNRLTYTVDASGNRTAVTKDST